MNHEPAIQAIALALTALRQDLAIHEHSELYPGYIAETRERIASMESSIKALTKEVSIER